MVVTPFKTESQNTIDIDVVNNISQEHKFAITVLLRKEQKLISS